MITGGGAINLLKVVLRFSPHQNKINLKFPLWPGIQMNTSVLLLLIFCQLVSQLELIGQPFWGVLDPKPKLGKEEGLASCEIALFNTESLIFFLYPQKERKRKKKQRPNFVIIPLWFYFKLPYILKHEYTVSVLHSWFSDVLYLKTK